MTILGGIDIETTGLKQEDGERIIELCLITYDMDDPERKPILNYTQRINPRKAINARAQMVHGIALSDLAREPLWSDVAPTISDHLFDVDILIAHNMAFDGPFVAAELVRADQDIPDIQSFCTMEEGRWSTATGKKPSLRELCFACEVEYIPEEAHRAEYDVLKMMDCFFIGLDQGFYDVSRLLRGENV